MLRSLLAKVARMRTLPVRVSSWLSTNSSLPSCGKPSSLARPTRTATGWPRGPGLRDAQVGVFVAVEAGVDAVERHHRGQHAEASTRLPRVISAFDTRPSIGETTRV
jgi:hypothetical protein